MAMDYSILDIRSFFTPHEAAMAWCEISELTKENQHDYRHIYHEIAEAIRTGALRAEIPVTYHDSWITRESRTERHPDEARIARDDLKVWAEAKGLKPKFLFPETRDEKRLKQETKASAKAQEIDKACVQAVGRTLWMLSPDMTAEEISGHKAIQIFCNGAQWETTTIKAWLREVDPRPIEKRRGRPTKSKTKNIQPQYEDVEK